MNKKKKAQEAAKPDPDADYQDEDEEEYDIPEKDGYVEDEVEFTYGEDGYSDEFSPDDDK